MAITGHLHRIVVGGKLAASETWSMSLHYLTPTIGKLAIAGPLIDAFKAWFVTPSIGVNTLATLDWCKANELDPLARINPPDPKTGLPRPASPPYTRYLDTGAMNELVLSPGSVPGTGSMAGPPQCTIAISLTTPYLRGLAHAGRIYPPSAVMVESDGRNSAVPTGNSATAAALLIGAINSSNGGQVVVYSGVRGQTANVVNGVRVGRVVDTQRRRRRNLVEDYQVHVIAGI